MCFINSAAKSYLVQNEYFYSLKCTISRKYSFQKVPQLSQGFNLLDAAASNIHGFFFRHPCISSSQLNRPIWSKQSITSA
jgi:hypothetical protein